MKKITISVGLLTLVAGSSQAEVVILDDPKPKTTVVESAPKMDVEVVAETLGQTGIIAVPLAQSTADNNELIQNVGENIDESSLTLEEIAEQVETVELDSGDLVVGDSVPEIAEPGAQDESVAQDEQVELDFFGNPIPVTNVSKTRRKENKISSRGRRDKLNLGLVDDSRPRNTIKATRKIEECKSFRYQFGLLKDNLTRLLSNCGFSIGQWNFGDDEYEFDFEVKKAYIVEADSLVDFLEQVKTSYLVQYRIHVLDKTVDFSASRGDRLKGLELQYR